MVTVTCTGEAEKKLISVNGRDVAIAVDEFDRMQLSEIYGVVKYVSALIECAMERRFKSSPLK